MINFRPIRASIKFYLIVISCLSGSLLSACSSTPYSGNPPIPTTQASATQYIDPETSPTISPTAATSSPRATQPPEATQVLSPNGTPTPTRRACWDNGGRIEERTLRSEQLPLPMEYLVYLPPCYDELLREQFPVLILIHGQNYDHFQWTNLGITEVADALISRDEISPLIIVMPRDRNWAQPTEDNFGRVLVEELVPTIDRNYRTIPERTYRAVGGLSRGAGWAVHLGLSTWRLFGTLGAHSLPVFWSDTPHIREWLDAIPEGSLPRIYLDIGDKDRPQILASAIWFEELLTEKGIPHEWYLFPGYHEEAYWQAHLEDYLRWYTVDW